jgi:putative sigma-54 modulation protein
MQIEVRFRGIESSEPLREHAVHRAHAHLSRFGPELGKVIVRLDDVNGPRGGFDKRCRVTVQGPRLGSATLDELSDNVHAALDLALDRMARVIGRSLAKTREFKDSAP